MEPRNYVYQGERAGAGNTRVVSLGVIQDDGTIKPFIIKWSKHFACKAIGAIYTGGEFGDNQCKGAPQGRFTGEQWSDKEDVLKWTVKENIVKQELQSRKLEKKVNQDLIETTLLPLRRLYTDMNYLSERIAFEQIVQLALRKPVR